MTTTANDDKAEKELSTANRPSKIRIENKRNQTLPTYPTLTVRYPSSNWEPDSPMIVLFTESVALRGNNELRAEVTGVSEDLGRQGHQPRRVSTPCGHVGAYGRSDSHTQAQRLGL